MSTSQSVARDSIEDFLAGPLAGPPPKERLIGVRHALVQSLILAAFENKEGTPLGHFKAFKRISLEKKVPQKNREDAIQYFSDFLRAKGILIPIEEDVSDPVEQKLASGVIDLPPVEMASIDPIEKQIFTLTSLPQPSHKADTKMEEEDIAQVQAEAEAENQQRALHKDFIFHVCSVTDDLRTNLVESWEKGDGLSTLMRLPMIIEREGQRAVIVQSFTVPFREQNTIVRFDWKANCRAVVVKHPNMFVQADGQKLIRSKIFEAKKKEFYAKGLAYTDGMVFKGYVEVNKRDREDLSVYCQVQGPLVVAITEKRYRELENLIAAGKTPTK